MTIIDLTQTFTPDMPVYPGDPKSSLNRVAEISKDGFTDHEIKSVMHIGTHMDAPLHMIQDGVKMSEINAERFIGRGVLIDAREVKEVGVGLLENHDVKAGTIILVMTGLSAHYRDSNYFDVFPNIIEEFAQRCVELGVKIVGMDTPGPDRPPFPTHKILLGNGILIVENLTNLEKLIGVDNFEVIALPMKLEADAAPVRVVARI